MPDQTPAEAPWYAPGLHFTCTGCGNCCTGAPGAVWVTDDDIGHIAQVTGKSLGEIRHFHTRQIGGRTSLTEFANGDCTFFDGQTRRCTVYAARPAQCRTWPFWESTTATPAAWRDVQRGCPGAGTGDFVSVEAIGRQVAAAGV